MQSEPAQSEPAQGEPEPPRPTPRGAPRGAGWLATAWGIGGVLLLLLSAIARLLPLVVEALRAELSWLHWLAGAAWCLFMAYAEGIRGFHRAFSPRVVARAFSLGRAPRALDAILAPAFAMSFYRSTRRRKVVAWGLLIGITLLVLLVRQAPQPWRGIIDAGVVLGLTIGTLSLLGHTLLALRHGAPLPEDLAPEDLPEEDERP